MGTVEFWEADAMDEDKTYSVELHKYLSLTLKLEQKGTISVNGGEAETIGKGKTWTSNKVQYGDRIIIETTGSCTITDGDYAHVQAAKDPLNEGYRYILSIRQDVDSDSVDALDEVVTVIRNVTVTFDTKDEHGTCEFSLDGETLSGTVVVKEGEEVELTYTLTDEDYEFAEGTSGIIGFFHDRIWSDERTIEFTISRDMDGTTVSREDYIEVVKKGE